MKRESGILLHISSLPSEYGVGDLGSSAYKFIDMLADNGFSVWQILPLGPLGPGNSPYQAYSAYAGDPIYISPNELINWGLLTNEDVLDFPRFNARKVEFEKVVAAKDLLFSIAYSSFRKPELGYLQQEYQNFKDEHAWWLNDYALYMACKNHFEGESWNNWENLLAKRSQSALEQYNLILCDDIEIERFKQFLFMRQWFRLKEYANSKGLKILGDVPLYVSQNSSDVWANQDIFLLDVDGNPTLVGGVPPDYFCEDGQLWGNPVFNWEKLHETEYQWWIARLYFNLHMFDLVRIDHFRGLESFWAVPADSTTAKTGQWLPANGFEILNIMSSRLGDLPIIAEDLGIITPEVEHLRNSFNLPGMKVLQFAFSSDESNEHLPFNYQGRNVVYTGTHDNNTTLGWWQSATTIEKKNAEKYLFAKRINIVKRTCEMAWASNAELAIAPMQDVLELGTAARMNTPGTATGNWGWRFETHQLKKAHWDFFKLLNKKYNRNNV